MSAFLAALIAATAAGAGLYVTARTLAETQQANREADQREREAQVTDRYTKAIGQLGDTQLAIRLGGIYALERIAVDSACDHRTIVEVLSAFVRNSSRPAASNRSPDDQPGGRPEKQLVLAAPQAGNIRQALSTDVQAALTVLGRLPSRDRVSRGDLTGAHLTGARLIRADLAGARFREAILAGADLGGADLARVEFPRADLADAILTMANLAGAQLGGADLAGAQLGGATLTGAQLGEADLTGADLGGATLTAAENLTQQQLDLARGDDCTELPAGLQRPAHWSAGLAVPPTAAL